jgi:hypothetical protein
MKFAAFTSLFTVAISASAAFAAPTTNSTTTTDIDGRAVPIGPIGAAVEAALGVAAWVVDSINKDKEVSFILPNFPLFILILMTYILTGPV